MRKTSFQNVGQQSLPPSSQLNTFMNDYEQLIRTGETINNIKPRSREQDIMNLLLIGSMNKGNKRNSLENLDQNFGSSNISQISTTTNNIANFGQQLLGQPYVMSQFDSLMPRSSIKNKRSMTILPMPQQLPLQQSQLPMQQSQLSIKQPIQSQFNLPYQQIQNQEKLLINGQIGMTVNQTQQSVHTLPEQPKTRIIDYIIKQNEVLEKLTKTIAQQREKESQDEKYKLLERMKKLEAQNAQDAFYNDMYDEIPPHMRLSQQFRPPPGYQYHPYFQQQNLYQQQFPTMPYPEKQKSKQQTLQMLRMLKQIKIENQRKKNQKNKKQQDFDEIINDKAEVDSYTSEETDPEPRLVQKPRILKLRPIPPPPSYDPKDDQAQLVQLIGKRALKKLKQYFIMLFFYIWKYNIMKKTILAKKQYVIKKGPEILQKFIEDTHGLFGRVLKNVFDDLFLPNLNIQIVPKPKQKISTNQMNQNIKKLKEILKKLFDSVIDNANESDFTENIMVYLNSITCEYAYLLDSQHLKFELNRLNFTYHGSLKNMIQKKQYMMIIISMIVKVLLYRLLSKAHIQIKNVKATDQLKTNMKTITSATYEIFMLFIKGASPIQLNNIQDIPIENIVKEKKDMYYQVDTFDATEEEIAKIEEAKQKVNSKNERIDEPLLFPIYSGREMAAFFDTERIFVTSLQQMVEGWCEKIYNMLQNYRNQKEIKRKEELRKNREQIHNFLAIKRDRVNKIIQLNQDKDLQISQEIEELTNKIAENKQKAKRAKDNYDTMIKQREERFNNMLIGGLRNMGSQLQHDSQQEQLIKRQY